MRRRQEAATSGQELIMRVLDRVVGCGGILAYHGVRTSSLLRSTHVTPEAFRTHMEFLAGSYDVVTLGEFVGRRKSTKSLRRCVAITFDDAYVGVLHHALPILEGLGLPATVFVATGFSRRAVRFWWDRFEYVAARLEPGRKAALLREVGLGSDAASHELRDHIITRSRGAAPRGLVAGLRRAEREVGEVPERAMTGEELQLLGRSGLIDFASHTVHHYALPWLEAGKIEKEIRLNHSWLRERLPRVRPYLAYPYGLYTRATVEAARRSGVEAAFSIEGRAATSRFPLYYCPRIGMADVNALRGLRLRLSWMTIPLVAARNGGWHPHLRPAASAAARRAQ